MRDTMLVLHTSGLYQWHAQASAYVSSDKDILVQIAQTAHNRQACLSKKYIFFFINELEYKVFFTPCSMLNVQYSQILARSTMSYFKSRRLAISIRTNKCLSYVAMGYVTPVTRPRQVLLLCT